MGETGYTPRKRVVSSVGSTNTTSKASAGGTSDVATSSTSDTYSTPLAEAREKAKQHGFVWVNLHNPSPSEIDEVIHGLNIDPRFAQLFNHSELRPMHLHQDTSVLVVLSNLQYVHPHAGVSGHVRVIGHDVVLVGEGHAVTVHRGHFRRKSQGDPKVGDADHLRTTLERQPELLAHGGPWVVLHAMAERATESYGDVVDALVDEVDDVETAIFGERVANPKGTYDLKKALAVVKRAIVPQQRAVEKVLAGEIGGAPEAVMRGFTELAERQRHILEQISAVDDLLASIVTASLTQVSVQQNTDMRKISAWAAIIAVLAIVPGIYGMNFTHMPELHWAFGYPLALVVMLGLASGLYAIFRRAGWL